MALTVRPISAEEHLAFVSRQRSVSFLQTPAWGRVKTEWRSESLGWFGDDGDEQRLVGAGLEFVLPFDQAIEVLSGAHSIAQSRILFGGAMNTAPLRSLILAITRPRSESGREAERA